MSVLVDVQKHCGKKPAKISPRKSASFGLEEIRKLVYPHSSFTRGRVESGEIWKILF
jgi:hypothetical protein